VSDPLMIYGATGYTGELVVHEALRLGLRPLLGGRNEAKLAPLAQQLGLDYRVASLGEASALEAALRDVKVVVHAAGPFSETAHPMVEACLRTSTHYLDISGEASVIEALAGRNMEARRQRIMLMPGVGFDVVPSDCLAAHMARRLPRAQRLAIGIRGMVLITRGSIKTFIEHAGRGIQVRRGGVMTTVPAGSLQRDFDYGDGPRPSVNLAWGDVITAYYTTSIPNIEVYFEGTAPFRWVEALNRYAGWMLSTAPWQLWLRIHAELLPKGPTEAQRAGLKMVIVAEVEDARGRRACARLHTPQAYTFTGVTASAVAQRVLQGDIEVGFQTPARVYGPDFVLSFPEVWREDVY